MTPVAAYEIRIATADDAEAIRAIYNDAVANLTATMDTDERTPEQQAAWMAAHSGPAHPALVAADADGRVLGWASLSPYHPKPGYSTSAEVSVYIHRDWRGRGVGSALLGALVREARAREVHSLVALITSGNEASIRLHARHGFAEVGTLREVARKFDAWVDVTFMQLLFPEPAARKTASATGVPEGTEP